MDDLFNDRRPSARPAEDDYATPVHRASLIDANARVRSATPAYHLDDRHVQIRTLAVQRHRSRESGSGDFGSIGEYMEFLTGSGS